MKIELQSLRGPELKAQDHYICRAQPLLRSRELFDKKGHVVTSWSNLVLFKDAVGLSSVPNASSECAVVAVGMFALFWCVPYMPKNTEWTQCVCVCVCVWAETGENVGACWKKHVIWAFFFLQTTWSSVIKTSCPDLHACAFPWLWSSHWSVLVSL